MINLNQWIREADQEANTLQEQKEKQAAEFRQAIRQVYQTIPALAALSFLDNLAFIRNELRFFSPVPYTEKEIVSGEMIG